MKKAELKEGVKYYVNSRSYHWARESYHATAELNRGQCFTIAFKDGEPVTYGNQVRVVSTVTEGTKWVQLSHIRGTWQNQVKKMTDDYRATRAYNFDRGRKYQDHLNRKAERERVARESSTREAFRKILNLEGWVSEYTQIKNLNFNVMAYVVAAVEAYEANNNQKVSA